MGKLKKNIKINRLQFLLIILIIIVIELYFILNCQFNLSQTISLYTKAITKQINVDDELETNEKLMGITDVYGQGVIMSILDGSDMIHQEDMIILLDELRNCGSEAISINDVRITNSTYLYCDGSVILIDGQKIGNPFTIKAIGNSETIYGALTRNKGYVSTLKDDGIEINIEQNDNIEIYKTQKTELLNYNDGKTKVAALKTSNDLIGKSDLQGKGIQIIIHEDKTKLSALSFLQIVNDLRTAGATAIAINGNRITNATDIMDISNTYVLVNSISIKGPFIIEAIGDIEKLEENIFYENSYITKIRSKGNSVEVYESSRILINKYEQKRDKDKMSIAYLK